MSLNSRGHTVPRLPVTEFTYGQTIAHGTTADYCDAEPPGPACENCEHSITFHDLGGCRICTWPSNRPWCYVSWMEIEEMNMSNSEYDYCGCCGGPVEEKPKDEHKECCESLHFLDTTPRNP